MTWGMFPHGFITVKVYVFWHFIICITSFTGNTMVSAANPWLMCSYHGISIVTMFFFVVKHDLFS